uniref:(California timema) hypothetical protein n=1 Tax=Timema californicum TaxID=61474 RepID=A0A7R9J8R0_TIMCA|nr:unnamed protein product [Timema californicum]
MFWSARKDTDAPCCVTVNMFKSARKDSDVPCCVTVNMFKSARKDTDVPCCVTVNMFKMHDGDYWRLLTPGKYVITAYRADYRPKSVRVTVVNQPHQEAPRVDFDLTPVVSRFEEEGNPNYDQPYDDILQDKMVTDLRKKWAYHSLGPKRRY